MRIITYLHRDTFYSCLLLLLTLIFEKIITRKYNHSNKRSQRPVVTAARVNPISDEPSLSSAPRTVEFIAELHNITVREGEDATFKCVVSPEDTHLTWCLNGERVHQDDRLTVISNGLCHTLCIKKCRVSDSARVTADAEGLAVSQANLQVQGEP